jgi:nucleoside-diphosphate-sugar epimerase
VLVTGASGFIGSPLCQGLHRIGAEVHAISRTKHSGDENRLRWWLGDLTEITEVQNCLRAIKPDIIFHLAGYPVGSRALDHIMPSFRNNFMSTVNLLTVATVIGCDRIILAGSLEEPESGDPQITPCSPYAAAKWAGSMYARMFYALYQLPVVMTRVFMVYGPGRQDVNRLIPYVILSLLRGEAPKLSSGQRMVDWIYVDDVVDGFLAAAQTAHIEGKTLDIGSGELVSIRSIVEHLVRLIDPQIKPLFGALTDRSFEQVRVADTKRTREIIGWGPVTSLEKGLQLTINWYKYQSNHLS